jgi:tetratricopeptide (TPR) repeat protein
MQYAERALAIDPSLRQAHGALGLAYLVYEWDLRDAENELASSQYRQSAMHTLICTSHLHLLGNREHLRHAEEDVRGLLEFDPHSATLIGELGCVSYYAGRYSDSIRYFREAIATDPRAAFVYWGAAARSRWPDNTAMRCKTLRRFKTVNGFEPPIITAEIGYSEAAAGDRVSALGTVQRLKELARHTFVDPYFMALVYLGLKDDRSTYEWLDRAYDSRSPFLISIATDPKWSAAHSDRRFQGVWNRMIENGAAVAASRGKPATSKPANH